MLWYKSWLETRWRFFIGLALLVLSAGAVVYVYPQVMQLINGVGNVEMRGGMGARIKEAVELQRDFRGYIFGQWLRQNLVQLGTVFAIILGSGGPYAQRSELFTLSLPVSRQRLVNVRALTGLSELFVIVFGSLLVIPVFAPSVGQSYSISAALIHAFCGFVACAVFFSLATLLSTSFSDIWRPFLIACGVGFALWLAQQVIGGFAPYSIFTVMSGESFFRSGRVPWMGLTVSIAVSAVMLYGAAVNVERRDF